MMDFQFFYNESETEKLRQSATMVTMVLDYPTID